MTRPVPDTSPKMMRLFLRARIVALADRLAAEAGALKGPQTRFRNEARRQLSAVVRRDARVTHAEYGFALAGRLQDREKRARIWKALDVEPGDQPASEMLLERGEKAQC